MKFLALLLLALISLSCTKPAPEEADKKPFLDPNLAPAKIVNGEPTFRIRDLKLGTGKEAKNGAKISVHYTAWLFDLNAPDRRGKEFESTKGKNPYEFTLGRGELLKGWEQGFFGFQVGGKRELTIPPAMGYGAHGFPKKVPPNASLVYEIDLIDVSEPSAPNPSKKKKK